MIAGFLVCGLLAASVAAFLALAWLIDRWAGNHEAELEAEDEK